MKETREQSVILMRRRRSDLLGGEESIGIDAEGQVADRLERSVIACAVAGVDVRTLDAGEPDLVTCTL